MLDPLALLSQMNPAQAPQAPQAPNPLLDAMLKAGTVGDQAATLQPRLRRAQALSLTPGAEGMRVGGTYQAASPLEHLATAMSRIMGYRQQNDVEKQLGDLVQQKVAGRQAFAQNPDAFAGALSGDPAMEAAGATLKPPKQANPDDLPAPPEWNALPGMTQGQAIRAGYGKPAKPDVTPPTPEQIARGTKLGILPAQNETSLSYEEAIRRAMAAAKSGSAGGARPGMQSQDDIEAIADAIVSGQQPPSLSELRSNTAAVRAALARRGYDLTAATADWAATQKHISTMNGPQQERLRQAVYTVTHSLDTLDDLYSQWQKVGPASGFKMFNRAAIAAAKNMPGEAGAIAQALDAQINDLTAELGQVYMGGNSPTDHALKLAGENLKSDWNEATFRKMLQLARTNLGIRQNSLSHSLPVGTRPDNPYFPSPQPSPAVAPAGPAMSEQDAAAKSWAQANPNDPRAAKILATLKAKGL